jgi:hypothetical protein
VKDGVFGGADPLDGGVVFLGVGFAGVGGEFVFDAGAAWSAAASCEAGAALVGAGAEGGWPLGVLPPEGIEEAVDGQFVKLAGVFAGGVVEAGVWGGHGRLMGAWFWGLAFGGAEVSWRFPRR